MKNITRKKARKVAAMLLARVTISVNVADISNHADRVRAYAYTVKAYDTNRATVARVTLYSSDPLTADIIANYVIYTIKYTCWVRTDILQIQRYFITCEHGKLIEFDTTSERVPWYFKRNGTSAEYLMDSEVRL
jgi:hypothetical protein